MPTDEQQIRDLVARWMTATKAGDTATVLSLMTDDVMFLVAGRQEPMRGKAAFAAALPAPPSAGTPAPTIDGTSDIQEIVVAGDHAYLWSKLRVVVTPPGGAAITRAGHTLTIFRKEAGRWLLCRDANMLTRVEG
ncbi:MAG: SgcJ/EcaC family oxidoreductase [Planctomycetales bacterium]|nr:SgcJ/EcaC family oxidoreductase [Planctomycetales bacterium]MBN8628831.1 SgcJ/EcaC family oxidoreductase [Planctomycetota bacterium]